MTPNKILKKIETNGGQRLGKICKNQSLCRWNHLCFIVLKRLCQLFRPLRQVLQCWKSPARMPMPSRTPNLLTPPDLKIWEQKIKWSWNDIFLCIYIYIYHISIRIYVTTHILCMFFCVCLHMSRLYWNFLWHLPRGCNFLCHRHFKLASVEHGDDCWCTRAMVVPHMASLQV